MGWWLVGAGCRELCVQVRHSVTNLFVGLDICREITIDQKAESSMPLSAILVEQDKFMSSRDGFDSAASDLGLLNTDHRKMIVLEILDDVC